MQNLTIQLLKYTLCLLFHACRTAGSASISSTVGLHVQKQRNEYIHRFRPKKYNNNIIPINTIRSSTAYFLESLPSRIIQVPFLR